MTTAANDAPLVDTHAHVYTLDMPFSATAWHKPPADATIDMYVDTLAKHGVKYAVIAAASLFDDYNEYSIEATRRHKHLRTTAIVKPTIDPYVMRMMKDDGVVGVRFQWRNVKNLPDITTPEYQKFSGACATWTGTFTSTRPPTNSPNPSPRCRLPA